MVHSTQAYAYRFGGFAMMGGEGYIVHNVKFAMGG